VAIRASLGARPQSIVGTIFSRALLQTGLGMLAGVLLVSLTVIKTPSGGRVVAAVAALILTVGLVACALPAWRALRIQPADALRNSG
jgi:ABC-type antimicrobial peptide transport system permease subunit